MATIRYAVLQIADEWRVVCERRRIGHFGSRQAAIGAGARLAREAVVSGHAVEFMIQDASGYLAAATFTAHLDIDPPNAAPVLPARAQA